MTWLSGIENCNPLLLACSQPKQWLENPFKIFPFLYALNKCCFCFIYLLHWPTLCLHYLLFLICSDESKSSTSIVQVLSHRLNCPNSLNNPTLVLWFGPNSSNVKTPSVDVCECAIKQFGHQVLSHISHSSQSSDLKESTLFSLLKNTQTLSFK